MISPMAMAHSISCFLPPGQLIETALPLMSMLSIVHPMPEVTIDTTWMKFKSSCNTFFRLPSAYLSCTLGTFSSTHHAFFLKIVCPFIVLIGPATEKLKKKHRLVHPLRSGYLSLTTGIRRLFDHFLNRKQKISNQSNIQVNICSSKDIGQGIGIHPNMLLLVMELKEKCCFGNRWHRAP